MHTCFLIHLLQLSWDSPPSTCNCTLPMQHSWHRRVHMASGSSRGTMQSLLDVQKRTTRFKPSSGREPGKVRAMPWVGMMQQSVFTGKMTRSCVDAHSDTLYIAQRKAFPQICLHGSTVISCSTAENWLLGSLYLCMQCKLCTHCYIRRSTCVHTVTHFILAHCHVP